MSRHLADRPRLDGAASRLRRFLHLERAEAPHPAARALHARRPALPTEGRLKPFLRILRGRPD
jgi:hypothetical protein